MEDILLKYYNQELRYIRELGGEFAKEYPKVAGRLGIDSYNCSDPFVERLLEGFAFLTARINYQIESTIPRVAESILSVVYPDSLTQTPAMFIADFTPDMQEGSLVNGYKIPRGTILKSSIGKDEITPCKFTTTADTTLYPVKISQANFQSRGLGEIGINTNMKNIRSMLRITLSSSGEYEMAEIKLNNLRLFLRGSQGLQMLLFELLLSKCCSIWIRGSAGNNEWRQLPESTITPTGLSEKEALFPASSYSMQGYRLLREYFSFHHKFMFVNISNLQQNLVQTEGTEVELAFLFNSTFTELEKNINENNFSLYSTPVINLFRHRCDMLILEDTKTEYKVIPDRTRAIDYEVYDILKVTGFDSSMNNKTEFRPFYANSDETFNSSLDEQAYYTVHRKDRMLTDMEQIYGKNSNYLGSDTYLSFVDSTRNNYFTNMHYISLEALCSNRGLPIQMARNFSFADFSFEEGMPVKSIDCIHGPTLPVHASTGNMLSDQMLSFLTLNYFSLSDNTGDNSIQSLKKLLGLYCNDSSGTIVRHIEGITDLKTSPIVRRIPGDMYGNMARGLEIEVTFNETDFEGTGCFLLGIILAEFFSQYISINSFTETVIKTEQRGELIRWAATPGKRAIF